MPPYFAVIIISPLHLRGVPAILDRSITRADPDFPQNGANANAIPIRAAVAFAILGILFFRFFFRRMLVLVSQPYAILIDNCVFHLPALHSVFVIGCSICPYIHDIHETIMPELYNTKNSSQVGNIVNIKNVINITNVRLITLKCVEITARNVVNIN